MGLGKSGAPAQSTRTSGVGLLACVPALTLCGALAALALWRLACVRLGPDPDTDAYGHYVIARQLLDTPLNLRIHWVWLPLYHVLLAAGVAAGATLDHVRQANALGATLTPLLSFAILWHRRPRAGNAVDALVPYLAAALTALSPIAMQLGTTGQMEVLFSVLVVLAVALLQTERHALAALVLGLCVLTRYEAWPIVMAVGGVLAYRHLYGGRPLSSSSLLTVLLPGACVLGWGTLRWWGGEPWFGFIFDNQAFAEGALERHTESGWQIRALGRYLVTVPWLLFGTPVLFSLIGLRRTLAREGVWLVAPPLAVLAFLTLTSLTQSQLGLERHFLVLVPFVATWVAHGVARSAEALSEAWQRSVRPGLGPGRVANTSFVLLALLVLGGSVERLETAMQSWQAVTVAALREQRAVGDYLSSTEPSSLIVCDDAHVEVLSGIDGSRFMRTGVGERALPAIVLLSRSRDVYMVGRAVQLAPLGQLGALSYGALDAAPDAYAVIHLRALGPRGGVADTGFAPISGAAP